MVQRAFINNENIATFKCPECHTARAVDVSRYKKNETVVKVKCNCNKCGHSHTVLLERRVYVRNGTHFPGVFYSDSDGRKNKGRIIVTDLSRSGLKFKLNSEQDFKIGEVILVEFELDDPAESMIRREVIIRNIFGLNIGAEFKSTEHYDKLGGYIFSRDMGYKSGS